MNPGLRISIDLQLTRTLDHKVWENQLNCGTPSPGAATLVQQKKKGREHFSFVFFFSRALYIGLYMSVRM